MIFRILVILVVCISCSPYRYLTKELKSAETQFQDHIGFVVFDPEEKKTLYEFNSTKYFTPASNTKIFTFYAGLNILGDSIESLRYIERNDSLIFWGTGDPSLFYSEVFQNPSTFNFLKNSDKTLIFSSSNFNTTPLGSGWAWSDYQNTYSVERSPLPVFGNSMTVTWNGIDSVQTHPLYFQKEISLSSHSEKETDIKRRINSNEILIVRSDSVYRQSWDLAFRTSPETVVALLSDTLQKQVAYLEIPYDSNAQTLYSIPADSLFRVMMQDSDNFIAEQILLLCSGKLSDTLNTDWTINYVKENYLADLPDKPQWVDGSGLSRYNLFTPRSIVALWDKIYADVAHERLFTLLAVGGQSGTLRNGYKHDPPYVFAKTGTLRNNHNLSGFLKTKKGKIFIFSFMNNHFMVPTRDVRSLMESTLKKIYEKN
ncbi:MAG: D-alanyl-D-alanine carboxypeptidase [Flammeovirgaceae bacterium]|nr:D-alanyl-D-alanine carboxypeptidase [Flammeovirgaceae bacterium]